jgi:hypothetical protein
MGPAGFTTTGARGLDVRPTGANRVADERGVHHSGDGGVSWMRAASYPMAPQHLRGLAFVR